MSFSKESRITAEQFREVYDYDPVNGRLIDKSTGKEVYSFVFKFAGEMHPITRWIWLHYYGEWPPVGMLIDHKDRINTRNMISNLRLATYSQNGCNIKFDNPNGRGVTFDSTRRKHWRAQIRKGGIKVNLGRFYTREEAAAAYAQAALDIFGEFACLD